MKFSPDGTLVNQDGASANGTAFLAIPNQALSARAVTILGSTGRIRGYKWNGSKWRPGVAMPSTSSQNGFLPG